MSQAEITGDGREYLAYARAFAAHLSPDFRQEDLLHVASMLDRQEPSFREGLEELGREYTVGRLAYGKGFVATQSGSLYSWHFWFYSMFVAPFFEFVHRMELPPASAFALCNWVFVLGALAYLSFLWKGSALQKHTLAALFLLSGTTYYIWWSHPEVFTASLILLALMMASDKRYTLGMMVGAIASTQNPPVFLLVIFISLLAVADISSKTIAASFGGRLLTAVRRIAPGLLSSIFVASLPALYFLQALGVASPIAAGGAANPNLISIERLWSLFFDLNLGIIVAAPGILLGITIVLLTSMMHPKDPAQKDKSTSYPFLYLCIFLSISMAVPTLSTTNWNHGHSVYSRYGFWVGIPLIFGLVKSIPNISTAMVRGVAITVIAIQAVVVSYYGVFGKNWRSNYISFKPISHYFLREFPQYYNPIPEIFIERISGKEGVPDPNDGNALVFAYPSTNSPTKLLLPNVMVDSIASKCAHTSIVRAEGGWSYVNLIRPSKCNLEEHH